MPTKYRAVKTYVDGIMFHSKREAARYSELKMLERCGMCVGLVLQPKFPIVVNGVKVCTYIADFAYRDQTGKQYIEDVKGVRTALFSLKAKLFHATYRDLRITEV